MSLEDKAAANGPPLRYTPKAHVAPDRSPDADRRGDSPIYH
jgi:hypothetical protein